MARMNFTLRQMLAVVTILSIVLGALVWLAEHKPESFVYAFFFTCSIGLLGFGIVTLSAVMLFSIYASPETDERPLNITKCLNLALIGALMISMPLLAAIATFVLLPAIRANY